jgi:hypothetical protein
MRAFSTVVNNLAESRIPMAIPSAMVQSLAATA